MANKLRVCLALVVYNQATVALAAKADSRYTFYILPPLLAAITMGLQAYSGRHTFNPRASEPLAIENDYLKKRYLS